MKHNPNIVLHADGYTVLPSTEGDMSTTYVKPSGVWSIPFPESFTSFYSDDQSRKYIQTGKSYLRLEGKGAPSLKRAHRKYEHIVPKLWKAQDISNIAKLNNKYNLDATWFDAAKDKLWDKWNTIDSKYQDGKISDKRYSKLADIYINKFGQIQNNKYQWDQVAHPLKYAYPHKNGDWKVWAYTLGLPLGIISGAELVQNHWTINNILNSKFAQDLSVGTAASMFGDELVRQTTDYKGIADGLIKNTINEEYANNPYVQFGAEFFNPVNYLNPLSVATKTGLTRYFDTAGNLLIDGFKIDPDNIYQAAKHMPSWKNKLYTNLAIYKAKLNKIDQKTLDDYTHKKFINNNIITNTDVAVSKNPSLNKQYSSLDGQYKYKDFLPEGAYWKIKQHNILKDKLEEFGKLYDYPVYTGDKMSTEDLINQSKRLLRRHNTFVRGVVDPIETDLERSHKVFDLTSSEARKRYAAITPWNNTSGVWASPMSNAINYGGDDTYFIRRTLDFSGDPITWFDKNNWVLHPNSGQVSGVRAVWEHVSPYKPIGLTTANEVLIYDPLHIVRKWNGIEDVNRSTTKNYLVPTTDFVDVRYESILHDDPSDILNILKKIKLKSK